MINHPVTSTQPTLVTRTGTLKAEASMGSEEEMVRLSKDLGVNEKRGDMTKGNDADNIFMEDVRPPSPLPVVQISRFQLGP